MRTRLLALAVCLLAAGACRHPQRVTDVPGSEGAGSTEAKSAKKAKESVHPGGGRPTVPSAPQGLMAPGAIAEIQQALAQRGFLEGSHRKGELDAPTSAALRKFQQSEDLAATGFPDRETLQKLQLDPDKAYRRAESAK